MALNVAPPRHILSHAHWTLGHRKMSKSIGNVVNPFFALERFGADVIRYYLAHDGGITNDTDFDNDTIISRYKNGLVGGLGNLTSRILRAKAWSVRQAIQSAHDKILPADDSVSAAFREKLAELPSKADKAVQQLDVGKALKLIMEVVYEVISDLQVTRLITTSCVDGCE